MAGYFRQAAGRIFGAFCPPGMHEEMAGDLQERFAAARLADPARADFWYCREVARSLPFLVLLNVRQMNLDYRRTQVAVLFIAISVLALWEAWGAQTLAWPLTTRILEYSFLSLDLTCRGTYICIYAVPSIAAMFAAALAERRGIIPAGIGGKLILICACAASFPGFYYMIWPGAYDYALFRMVQISAVWAMAILALILARCGKKPSFR